MNEDQLHAAVSQLSPQEGALIRVLAAVIRDAERYLVCLRPAHKRHGGHWEFPGGKLEHGETLLDAARRELKEELGLDVVKVGKLIFSHQDPGSPFLIEFLEVQVTGVPEPKEHNELRWASLEELQDLQLAPSDEVFRGILERNQE